MHDIRAIGESSALINKTRLLNKQILYEVDSLYKEKYSDGEGGIMATFNIITITALAANG